jgi:putative glutamine amidotransferase
MEAVSQIARPWIGIPTRFENDNTTGKIRNYLEAVISAGGVPIMIPVFAPPATVAEYTQRLDGVLLPGSPSDIDPARYRAAPHPRLGKLTPEREALDFSLLEHAERAQLPVLGICFGVQSINVFRGGTLVQDIPSIVAEPLFHETHGEPKQFARHAVQLDRNSLLAKLAGTEFIEVNSFHHQAVETHGRDLTVVGTAPDGVVEAIEDRSGRFVVGVQWHPERSFRDDPFSRALFQEFIREAAK